MSDDDDNFSDSDDSDIGKLLRKAHHGSDDNNKNKANIDKGASLAMSDDDSDDSDSDDDLGVLYSSRKKRRNPDSEMNRMDRQFALRRRRRQQEQQLKRSRDSDDESDSDDYDDDEDENEENDVFVSSTTTKPVVNLLLGDDDYDCLSSDDDENKNNRSKRNGPSRWRELKRKGVLDSPTMRQMQQVQKATSELKHQEHDPAAAVQSPVRVLNLVHPNNIITHPASGRITRQRAAQLQQEVIELTSTPTPQQQQTAAAGAVSSPSTQLSPIASPPRPILLNIQAEITNTFNNVAEKTIHTQVALSTNNTVQELIHVFLQQQQLSKTTTVGLMYRGKPLHTYQTLQNYGFASSGTQLQATVYTNVHATTKHHHDDDDEDVGKRIQVKLQTKDGNTLMAKIGMKQWLRVLVDQFRSEFKIANQVSIQLKFDGEMLPLNQTPDDYDMEDDDQIDVVVG